MFYSDSLHSYSWHCDSSSSGAHDDADETMLQQQHRGDDDEDGNDKEDDGDDDESGNEEDEESGDEESSIDSEEFYESDSSCGMMSLSNVQSDDEDFGSTTDEEDREAFQHWDNKWYQSCILPIKRSQHNFNLCPVWLRDGYNSYDTTIYFTEQACKQLGQHLFKNDKVIKIDLSDLRLTDDCVAELFLPWKQECNDGRIIANRQRIKELYLCCNPMIGPSGIRGLVPFLNNNSNLHVLRLSHVNMGLDGARALSSIFEDKSNYTSCMLDHLDVSDNDLGDAAIELLSRALKNVTTLKKLDLSSNGIEGYECVSPLLECLDHQSSNPTSSSSSHFSLRKLFLARNNLTNNFITPLSQALLRDKILTKVDLSENPRITEDGWNSLLNIVYNTSSIRSLFESNHTIRSFGYLPHNHHARENMAKVLKANNALEWTSSNIGRQKIVAHCVSVQSPIYHEVVGIDIKVMPNVFALLGDEQTFGSHNLPHHKEEEQLNQEAQKITSIYRIIRNWNMPSLFSYQSRERAHMDSCKRGNDCFKNDRNDFKRGDKRLRTELDQLESNFSVGERKGKRVIG